MLHHSRARELLHPNIKLDEYRNYLEAKGKIQAGLDILRYMRTEIRLYNDLRKEKR